LKPELYNLRIDTKTKSGFLRMKERTLLKQLQRKNEKALEEIMKKYGAYVTTISKEILAGKGTKEDVEEVVSDVFISLWNTAERIDYEKYTSIKAYIGMIARNKAKDKIRAIKSWNLELYDDVLLIDNQAERLMEQKEQQRIIQKLGPVGNQIINKLVAFFTFCIGIQISVTGISQIFHLNIL
jgi:RNA polymerase sigma factor (sigma-70 family)